MSETWRPTFLPGIEASDLGRVRNTVTGNMLGGCLLPTGYIVIGYKGRNFRVHQLVLDAFDPRPSEKHIPNHLNLDKADNRLANLEWATIQENTQHAYDNGCHRARGATIGSAKLTEHHVWVIRLRWALGDPTSRQQMANQYRVSASTIADILARRTWSHCL